MAGSTCIFCGAYLPESNAAKRECVACHLKAAEDDILLNIWSDNHVSCGLNDKDAFFTFKKALTAGANGDK